MRGVEHIVSLFSNDFSKTPIVNQIISSHNIIYNIFGSGIYHKPHSIFKSKYQEFHNITLVFLVEMRLKWRYISWECTETRGCRKFFKPLYCLHNSPVFLPITNLTNQLGIFMIISHGKGAMYFSRFCFLVLEFFAWQIVIIQ